MSTLHQSCSFDELAKRTLNLIDLSQEVVAVQVDDGSAAAGELLVRLEPSDGLCRFAAAIRTRDFDGLLVEHDRLLSLQKNQKPAAANEAGGMAAQPIDRVWSCTRCGAANDIYNDTTFKDLCLDLLAGRTGMVICRDCGQTDQVIFRNASLELVMGA